MTCILVHGAAGRMGQRICALAETDERFDVTVTIDRFDPSAHDASDVESSDRSIDVVIDFSSDDGAQHAAAIARRQGAALLIGTTGLSSQTLDVLDESARTVAVMIAPNTSRGVAVLNRLLADAIAMLGRGYQIDLFEQHHRLKKDAPSGTAMKLLRTCEGSRGESLPEDRIHVVRAGDIVGEHEIQLTGTGEILCLRHSAVSRDVFAAGALDAAAWLHGRPPGRYAIEDSLDSARGRSSSTG